MAFIRAKDNQTQVKKIFSAQNWLKNRDSYLSLKERVQMHIDFLDQMMANGAQLRKALQIPPDAFDARWEAE
jgi:hypothetical protein